jgi:phage baseplate assembly protein W
MDAIGVKYPITKGNSGFFNQTFDTISAQKSNLYILFYTIPGERAFNTDFGLNIRRFLFEPISNDTKFIIESEIKNKIQKYLPKLQIDVLDINIESFQADRNRIIINLSFSLKNDNSQNSSIQTIF